MANTRRHSPRHKQHAGTTRTSERPLIVAQSVGFWKMAAWAIPNSIQNHPKDPKNIKKLPNLFSALRCRFFDNPSRIVNPPLILFRKNATIRRFFVPLKLGRGTVIHVIKASGNQRCLKNPWKFTILQQRHTWALDSSSMVDFEILHCHVTRYYQNHYYNKTPKINQSNIQKSHPKSPAIRLARLQSRVSQRLASIPCGASSASVLAGANTCTNTDPYDSWPHIEVNFRSARTAGFDLSFEFTALHVFCTFCRALNLTEMLWGLCIIWSDDDFKLSCRVGQLLH